MHSMPVPRRPFRTWPLTLGRARTSTRSPTEKCPAALAKKSEDPAAGPVVLLAELLRRDRARLRGAPAVPPTDAVARLLWTCGTHDRDHWSHAFLRNALLYF